MDAELQVRVKELLDILVDPNQELGPDEAEQTLVSWGLTPAQAEEFVHDPEYCRPRRYTKD